MSNIVFESCKVAIVEFGKGVGISLAMIAGGATVCVLAPIVSCIAVPIFAVKAASDWSKHRALYEKTLTFEGTREKFGRIPGQDYTKWDGKAIFELSAGSDKISTIHELMGQYLNGAENSGFTRVDQIENCPFDTGQDLQWLKQEYSRREKKDLLDYDLKMLRAFSKTLIPIAGLFWVLLTETGAGGASEMGCRACMLGGTAKGHHWGWGEALRFHTRILTNKLNERM